MKCRKLQQKSRQGGFTLIELLVAFTIFAIVSTAAVGAFLTLVDAHRKAQAFNIAFNNLNFALESMARNIRIGYSYRCNGPAPANPDCSNGTSLYFESDLGDPTDSSDDFVYRFNSSEGSVERSVENGAAGSFFTLTAPEITITDMRFIVRGAQSGGGDTAQPNVFLIVRGEVGIPTEEEPQTFVIQTLATQRNPDF